MQWFRDAGFGMFIHWGLNSLLGRDMMAQHNEALPLGKYEGLADQFYPAEDCAARWARLAKRAGAKYVVFVTKHHDGFCLFNSALTDFCAAKHGARRDYVREVTEAVRAEGLGVGLYYSLPDFHHPAYVQVGQQGDLSAAPALREYLHGHVRELLSNYGRIDLLWYDGAAWATNWPGGIVPPEVLGSAELNAMARELQPGLLINDRSGLPEDFFTAENALPTSYPAGDWELCICLNDLWGYHPHDYNYKTRNQLIFLLVSCAVNGGNLLLNIGPRGDGTVPEPQVERMAQLGDWLAVHGESVYGVERLAQANFHAGRMTRKGRTLYLHAFYWPGAKMRVPYLTAETLQGEPGRAVVRARCLTTGEAADAHWDGDVLEVTGLSEAPPDKADTVVAVEVM